MFDGLAGQPEFVEHLGGVGDQTGSFHARRGDVRITGAGHLTGKIAGFRVGWQFRDEAAGELQVFDIGCH